MSRTSIGTREVRDGSVARSDVDISTSGESLITKVVAGSDVSLTWTGADPGTGDVTVSFVGGSSTAIPLDVYELADWYGGQQITATPITLDFDGPRYPNANYANVGGELEFLSAGSFLVLSRATASITSGTNRSETHMFLEKDVGAGWEIIWGSEAFIYHRIINRGKGTATSLITFNAVVGDKIRIRLERTGGTSTIKTEDDGSNLIVVSLAGTRGEQGVQGQDGVDGGDGDDGNDGVAGSQIFNGTTVPNNSLGVDTDIYINTSTNEYYQKNTSTWGSPVGTFGGGGGVSDHGNLAGLLDDDHTHYHNNARGDARYSPLGHTHTSLANLELTLQKLEVLQWMGSD